VDSESIPAPDLPLPQYLARIQASFERGQYRQALEEAKQAQGRYPQAGQLRLWQALAQEALGETEEAVRLVQSLLHSPDPELAQQARYVLSIWQAPRLRRPAEWSIQIPDLSHLEEAKPESRLLVYERPRPRGSRPTSPAPLPSQAAPSVNTQRLNWVLIGILSALLATLAWLP
jgi:tetratricopeptide (TPR) repeat protein